MQTLTLTWKGETLEFKPSFELFMRIEEKVAFNRITDDLRKAGAGNAIDLPMSHVAWVLYCCLRHSGSSVRTPMDVHQALFDGSVEYGSVLSGLIVAYYGAQPQKVPKKKATARTPRPLSQTSRNDTALQ